jgi:predicted metal-dependent phosphoesterase TrpH
MRVYFQQPNIQALRGQYFLVDMHFHSKYSHDSSTPVEQIVRRAQELGIRVALTDHNSIAGVLAAEKIAPGVVMPGIEICTKEGKDILAYFSTVAELEAFFHRVVKPHLRRKTSLQSNATSLSAKELLVELSRERCVVAIAHPFAVPPRRSHAFFGKRRELLQHTHAIEVLNMTMLHSQNLSSIGWAVQHHKPMIGGSDGHTLAPLGSALTVAKAQSWEEFLDHVVKRKIFVIGEERRLRHQIKHQVVTATRLLTQKARVFKNFRQDRRERKS